MKEMQNQVIHRGRARQDKCSTNEDKLFSANEIQASLAIFITHYIHENLSVVILILTNILHKRINNLWQNQGYTL